MFQIMFEDEKRKEKQFFFCWFSSLNVFKTTKAISISLLKGNSVFLASLSFDRSSLLPLSLIARSWLWISVNSAFFASPLIALLSLFFLPPPIPRNCLWILNLDPSSHSTRSHILTRCFQMNAHIQIPASE